MKTKRTSTKPKHAKVGVLQSPYVKEALDAYINFGNDKKILALHVVAILDNGTIRSDTVLGTNAIHRFAMIAKLEQDVSELKVSASEATSRENLSYE